MDIPKITEQMAITQQTMPKSTTQTVEEKTNSTLASDNADKYVKSDEVFTPAYTKKSAQKKEVDNADVKFEGSVAQTKADHLSSVVDNLIAHQAEKHNSKKNQIEWSGTLKNQLEEITGKKSDGIEGAAEDYWGAEATAKRIFDFAKNLAGDNNELIDTLKDAFLKGFGMAEKAYGKGKSLPGVCYETKELVLGMFDEWKNPKTEEVEEKADSAAVIEKADVSEGAAK